MFSVGGAYLAIGDIHSQIDVSKATAPNLSHQPVLSADLKLRLTPATAARHLASPEER